jgi:hypothetical protein
MPEVIGGTGGDFTGAATRSQWRGAPGTRRAAPSGT